MKKIILGLVLSLLLTASANAAEFNNNLKYGSRGTEVKKLQEFLAEQDLYSGPITGNFFSLTLKAVKAFQSREHISPVSGFFGVLSRAKANTILDEQLAESDNISEQVTQTPDTSLGDVVNKLTEQNKLLQDTLNLQKSEADRLKAEREAEAARLKAIADAADAAANARQQAEQAARDLAAQQAATEASRPFTQQEMDVLARQILRVRLTEMADEYSTSSISFNWINGNNAYNPATNDTRVVFYGQDILNKNGPLYSALTFENNQVLLFVPPAELYIPAVAQPYADSIAQGFIPIPNRPGYFYRPRNLIASRPCNGYCSEVRIGGLYFKPEGWKYQIIFSYPGRQESTYEGTFNIPAN